VSGVCRGFEASQYPTEGKHGPNYDTISPALVFGTDHDAFGVIMPIRQAFSPYSAPGWYYAKEQQSVAA